MRDDVQDLLRPESFQMGYSAALGTALHAMQYNAGSRDTEWRETHKIVRILQPL